MQLREGSKENTKKIVVFYEDAYHGIGCISQNLIFDGYEKINYDKTMQKDLEYFAWNKDGRIFQDVMDYCKENKIDHLHLSRLHLPEYFLIELKSRDDVETEISFMTEWRMVGLSRAKAYCFSELFKCPEVKRAIVISQLGPKTKGSEYITDDIYNSPKIRNVYEMPPDKLVFGYDRETERKKYGYTEDDFVVLFFGSMLFGKGIDIFSRMIDIMNNNGVRNFKFLISSAPERLNFDFDYKALHEKRNTVFFDKFVSQEEMGSMYTACNCVAVPYKDTYKYGSSNILTTAAFYKKPVVSCDVYPIGETVKKYNLGLTYSNIDNVEVTAFTLAGRIIDLRNSKKEYHDYEGYTSKIQSWEEYSKLIVGD